MNWPRCVVGLCRPLRRLSAWLRRIWRGSGGTRPPDPPEPVDEPWDDFLEAIDLSCARAGHKLRARNLAALERLIDLDKSGEIAAMTWLARMPAGGDGEREVSLPLLYLQTFQVHEIASLQLEFDCVVDEISTPQTGPRMALRLGPSDGHRRRHQVTVELAPEKTPPGTVLFDGRVLRHFGHALAAPE